MTRALSGWVAAAALAAAGLAGLAVWLVPAAPAAAATQPVQPVQPGKDPLVPAHAKDFSVGYTACKRCHENQTREAAAKDPFARDFRSNEFVLLTEGATWQQQDPHYRAYEVLKSPLGGQMSRLLKDSHPGYKDGVTKAPQCLTCHAIDTAPTVPLAAKQFDHFRVTEGITCNACHGIRPAWQDQHYKGEEKFIPWRILSPEQKREAGLRNLRDPATRAAFCATCHVGSVADGRVVTHEMYAAGHPPLPPFELGTFMECQPRHWGYPTDPTLKFFAGTAAEEYAAAGKEKLPADWRWSLYRFHPADQEVYIARSVAAGAVAALQAEMRMLAADAAEADRPDSKSEGIDFARFDCYACHHDLKVPSARQQRGYDGAKPGRPPMKAWLAALPGVVADHAATLPQLAAAGKGFHPKWAAVRAAALARPFGDPRGVKAAAADLAGWCDEFLRAAADGKPLYTKEAAGSLLAAVGEAATSAKWTADPEAAMHLTWAYLSLRGGVGSPPDAKALAALAEAVPVRVREAPYSTKNKDMVDVPVPAGAAIPGRLRLFGAFSAESFTPRFQELLKR
jgi:hypothetical protein